jgi:hypothetical protein
VEFPDRRLADLIALLVERLPARSREKALREAGVKPKRTTSATACTHPFEIRSGRRVSVRAESSKAWRL